MASIRSAHLHRCCRVQSTSPQWLIRLQASMPAGRKRMADSDAAVQGPRKAPRMDCVGPVHYNSSPKLPPRRRGAYDFTEVSKLRLREHQYTTTSQPSGASTMHHNGHAADPLCFRRTHLLDLIRAVSRKMPGVCLRYGHQGSAQQNACDDMRALSSTSLAVTCVTPQDTVAEAQTSRRAARVRGPRVTCVSASVSGVQGGSSSLLLCSPTSPRAASSVSRDADTPDDKGTERLTSSLSDGLGLNCQPLSHAGGVGKGVSKGVLREAVL